MNDVVAEAPVVLNRCRLDEVFAGPFIELIGLAPRNPVVRGLILSQTGRLPEPERVTFESIKEWVETTCAPRAGVGRHSKAAGLTEDGFVVKVEFSETEHGRAHYSVGRSGSAEFALDAEELVEMVQKALAAGAGLEEVIDDIATLIDEDAWNRCDPDMDDYGDYEYDDHDAGDSDNTATEFSRTQIRERLRHFLRERHPELLEELT
jgi:hypothetical protein